MAEPKRIQLRRTKGWRKPEGVVVVSRPSRWGNPWRIRHADDRWEIVERDPELGETAIEYAGNATEARAAAVAVFRAVMFGGVGERPAYPSAAEVRAELAGRHLACWCPLVDAEGHPVPCHADVLLEIANGGAP